MPIDRVMLQIIRTANGWMVLPPPRGDMYPEWPATYVFTDHRALAEWVAEWARQQEQPAARGDGGMAETGNAMTFGNRDVLMK